MSDTAIFLAELCGALTPDECLEIRTFQRGGAQDGNSLERCVKIYVV